VDYNDTIKRGDVLAELNTDTLKFQREQQMAQVFKARANYELQLVNFQNQEKLAEKNLISEYEYKTGKTTLDIHAAELSAAEASLRVIETEINQYASITSPIDGIVLEKNISEGATVVDGSSSNAASVFTLAENLEEMQIETGVGELDIKSIYQGQPVRFTLESLPGRTYSGTVETVRLMPTVQSNVVSYTVIINVDNKDGSLLPGMTCAVEFIEDRSENILLAPNAALRYQPTALSAAEIADRVFYAGLTGMDETGRAAALAARSEAQSQNSGAAASNEAPSLGLTSLITGGGAGRAGGMGAPGGGGGPPGMGGAPGAFGDASGGSGSRSGFQINAGDGNGSVTPGPLKTLWYLDSDGKLDCILVRTGITDGSYTEVSPADPGTDLEGLRIILREKV
jgi:HlyD family secretion protein